MSENALKNIQSSSVFKILLLLILSSVCREINCQILNIERHRLQKDTAKTWMVNGTLGIRIYNRSAAADSPVDMFGYNASVNSVYFSMKHSYAVIGQLDYLRINDSDFLNFGFLHFRSHLYHRNTSSWELFGQISYDNFRGLDPRILVGSGLRQRLLESDASALHLGLGILFESEWWSHPTLEQTIDVQYLKSTSYLSFRHSFSDLVDFNAIVYYQLGYDRNLSIPRQRSSGVINLNSKLTRVFSITNSFEFSYEDKPIVPITRFIFQFKTGLTVSF